MWLKQKGIAGTDMKRNLTEKLYDETGKLIHSQEWWGDEPFNIGDVFTLDDIPMEVLSCDIVGDKVIMKAKEYMKGYDVHSIECKCSGCKKASRRYLKMNKRMQKMDKEWKERKNEKAIY